jgi:hypothetical protein
MPQHDKNSRLLTRENPSNAIKFYFPLQKIILRTKKHKRTYKQGHILKVKIKSKTVVGEIMGTMRLFP